MKQQVLIPGLLIGIVVGGVGGFFVAREQARVAVLSGPYSDNYQPALDAMAEAKAKLQSGDTNVLKQLNIAQTQIEQAQRWTKRFLDQPGGAANRSQPVGSDRNGMPPAAGSRR